MENDKPPSIETLVQHDPCDPVQRARGSYMHLESVSESMVEAWIVQSTGQPRTRLRKASTPRFKMVMWACALPAFMLVLGQRVWLVWDSKSYVGPKVQGELRSHGVAGTPRLRRHPLSFRNQLWKYSRAQGFQGISFASKGHPGHRTIVQETGQLIATGMGDRTGQLKNLNHTLRRIYMSCGQTVILKNSCSTTKQSAVQADKRICLPTILRLFRTALSQVCN